MIDFVRGEQMEKHEATGKALAKGKHVAQGRVTGAGVTRVEIG